jgi:phospholipase C
MREEISPFLCLQLSSAIVLASLLTACGSGNSGQILRTASYSLSASTLTPESITAGNSSTSTITVKPANGYEGTITLACLEISGGNPLPNCSFSPSSVSVTSTTTVSSTLTLTASASAPNSSYTIGVTGADGNNQGPSDGTQNLSLITIARIQHIVLIVQENRTPDNLFQDPVLIGEGADIASSGLNSQGQTITLQPTSLGIDYDLSHKHDAFTEMCDLDSSTNTCKMDGADLITITCSKDATGCPPPNAQFLYVQQSDVQPYWDMAEQYTFADHMFQTNEGPSFPAHQFLLSGTSEPSAGSNLFVAENATGGTKSPGTDTGCTAPAGQTVALIDPTGNEASNNPIFPCFEHATLTDEFDTAGITWRYYAASAGSLWTAPNAIQHMCAPPESAFCTAPDWANVSLPPTGSTNPPILTDIATGQLEQVSWVIPAGQNSDHAGDTTTTGGPSWVASIVNAIGNSSYWNNTAIIIVWDDWGGWYDHVSPTLVDDDQSWGSGYVYGFRVPMIIVSPYALPTHISSTPHDFGSILSFIEATFALPSLGQADAHASHDLSDCFNFSQPPLVFQTINAPLKADFFLRDTRPPQPPDTD